MLKPIVYFREELEMPEGKLAAQVSHALMMLVTSQMKDCEEGRIISSEKSVKLNDWIISGFEFDLIPSSEKEMEKVASKLNKNQYKKVVDQGRTVFEGVKTLTCMVVFPEGLEAEEEESHNKENLGEIRSKQHVLLNIREIEKNIPELMAKASVSVLFELANVLDEGSNKGSFFFDFNENEALATWLNGSFAKIGLGTKKKKKIEKAMVAATESGIKFTEIKNSDNEPVVVAFEPSFPESLKGVTSSFHTI